MTHRDYEIIAGVFRHEIRTILEAGHYLDMVTINRLVAHLALRCKQQNPGFDRDRFFAACGLGEN